MNIAPIIPITRTRKSSPGPRLSVEPLLSRLGTHPISPRLSLLLRTAKSRGYFTLAIADEIACDVLDLHPHTIWGEEYEDKVWFDMGDDPDAGSMALVAA